MRHSPESHEESSSSTPAKTSPSPTLHSANNTRSPSPTILSQPAPAALTLSASASSYSTTRSSSPTIALSPSATSPSRQLSNGKLDKKVYNDNSNNKKSSSLSKWLIALQVILFTSFIVFIGAMVWRRSWVMNGDNKSSSDKILIPTENAHISSRDFNFQPILDMNPIIQRRDRFLRDLTTVWETRRPEGHAVCSKYYPLPHSTERYRSLRGPKYFIAINLYQNEAVIPDLFTQLTLAIEYLGYDKVFVSIFENGSTDDTKVFLYLLERFLADVGVSFRIMRSSHKRAPRTHRIEYLAQVRNVAMEPFYNHPRADEFAKVIFLNDIFFCRDDLLELIFQSYYQKADMTCGIDYDYSKRDDKGYYDTWVGRSIDGNDLQKWPFEKQFRNHDDDFRLQLGLPIQVQCCWNGGAVMNPKAFLDGKIRFRRSNVKARECSSSECSILCNDFMRLGYPKILVVPRVKVTYEIEAFKEVVEAKMNMTHYRTFSNHSSLERIVDWKDPPKKVLCLGLEGLDRNSPDRDAVWEPLRAPSYNNTFRL